jgi:hypothetical protein
MHPFMVNPMGGSVAATTLHPQYGGGQQSQLSVFGGQPQLAPVKAGGSAATTARTAHERTKCLLDLARRDEARWRRRAVDAEARFEQARSQHVFVLLHLLKGADQAAPALAAWLQSALEDRARQQHAQLGAQVLARIDSVRTYDELLQVAQGAQPAGSHCELGQVQAQFRQQGQLLEQAWSVDCKPRCVQSTLEELDLLLETQQRELCAWRCDLQAVHALKSHLVAAAVWEPLQPLLGACQHFLIVLDAQLQWLEKQVQVAAMSK